MRLNKCPIYVKIIAFFQKKIFLRTMNYPFRNIILRSQSTLSRTKTDNWKRVPHFNVLCIGDSNTGKTQLAQQLSGYSYDDIARQTGSYNSKSPTDFSTKSTGWVEYEVGNSKFHCAHIDTPGNFINKNLSAAYNNFDICIWNICSENGCTTTKHLELAKKLDKKKNTNGDFINRLLINVRNTPQDVNEIDDEMKDLVLDDLRDHLEATGLGGVSEENIIFGSDDGLSLEKIKDSLTQICSNIEDFKTNASTQSTAIKPKTPHFSKIALERSFKVTDSNQQICIGILEGTKELVPTQEALLISKNKIIPVEIKSTGMFYKQTKTSLPNDRVNVWIKSKINKFEQHCKKGAVLLWGNKINNLKEVIEKNHFGKTFRVKNHQFEKNHSKISDYSKFQKAGAHTWLEHIENFDGEILEIRDKWFAGVGDKITVFSTDDFCVFEVVEVL